MAVQVPMSSGSRRNSSNPNVASGRLKMSTQRSTAAVEGLATTDQVGSNRMDIAQMTGVQSPPFRCTGAPLVPAPIRKTMARPESDRPRSPRLPPDLPPDPDLRITGGAEINRITVQGGFSGDDLEGLLVEESHIVHSSFTAADLHRIRLVDVLVDGSDFSGADMDEASSTRVTFAGCRMSGALLSRAQMRDVTFSEVRLDGVNYRMIEGELVLFDHVNLERADFSAARVKTAWFFDCDLSGADMSQTKLPGSRFHGSLLSDIKGSEYLRYVVIDSAQVLPLAKGVFAALNIRIEDDRESDVRKGTPASMPRVRE